MAVVLMSQQGLNQHGEKVNSGHLGVRASFTSTVSKYGAQNEFKGSSKDF